MRSSLAFVAMPFASRFDALYQDVIKIAASVVGLTLVRLERLPASNIINTMEREIDRSDFLIAVATERNPHVFFEIALAYANRKPCIILGARQADFDIFENIYTCLSYSEDAEDVRRLLSAEFVRLINATASADTIP